MNILSKERKDTASLVEPQQRLDSVAPSTFDFFQWFHGNIVPPAFFLGIIIGLLACSLAGYATSRVNIFRNFERFYLGIGPDSFFYPTISEMKAIAKSKLSDKQILVVVTGNSVFNGVGQPVAELWTKRLQNLLGPNYCVVNLAMRGGGPFETGYLAAESLFKEHYRVICITLADPAQAMPQGEGTTYGYMYWQARYRNELSNFPARDKAIEERIAAFPVPERERISELKLRAQLDSIFYFTDLWNFVANRYFSTVWHQVALNPFCARKNTVDDTPAPAAIGTRLENLFNESMTIVRAMTVQLFIKGKDDPWQPNEQIWKVFDRNLETVCPSSFRSHILVTTIMNSPYHLGKLSTDERERNAFAYAATKRHFEEHGYHCVEAGQKLTNEDYFDRVHLTGSGGKVIADEIAPKVIQLCKNERMEE